MLLPTSTRLRKALWSALFLLLLAASAASLAAGIFGPITPSLACGVPYCYPGGARLCNAPCTCHGDPGPCGVTLAPSGVKR